MQRQTALLGSLVGVRHRVLEHVHLVGAKEKIMSFIVQLQSVKTTTEKSRQNKIRMSRNVAFARLRGLKIHKDMFAVANSILIIPYCGLPQDRWDEACGRAHPESIRHHVAALKGAVE